MLKEQKEEMDGEEIMKNKWYESRARKQECGGVLSNKSQLQIDCVI